MADSLKVEKLSLNDSQHAPSGGAHTTSSGRTAYIPPHLRQQRNAGAVGLDGAGAGGPHGNRNSGSWGAKYAFLSSSCSFLGFSFVPLLFFSVLADLTLI